MSGLDSVPISLFLCILYENRHKDRDQRPQWYPTQKLFHKLRGQLFYEFGNDQFNEEMQLMSAFMIEANKSFLLSHCWSLNIWSVATWSLLGNHRTQHTGPVVGPGGGVCAGTAHQSLPWCVGTGRELSSVWPVRSPRTDLCCQWLFFLGYEENLSGNEPQTQR